MSRFFVVDRPIVAIVIAVLTVILGVVSLLGLPVAQYTSIIPPIIQIDVARAFGEELQPLGLEARDTHRAVPPRPSSR